MKKILYLIIFVFLLIGCENKNDLALLAKKLKSQKEQSLKNKSDTTVKKEKYKKQKKIQNQKAVKKDDKEEFVNKEIVKKEIKNITDLNLTTLSNKTIKLRFKDNGIDFKTYPKKVVILDVFTTWCPPCLESIPHLVELQKKYKDSLQVIGILHEDNIRKSIVLKFKKEHHINYPITVGKNNFVLTNTWGGVSGYPTIIIFDKNGDYFNHYNGSPPLEMLQSDIKKILEKR